MFVCVCALLCICMLLHPRSHIPSHTYANKAKQSTHAHSLIDSLPQRGFGKESKARRSRMSQFAGSDRLCGTVGCDLIRELCDSFLFAVRILDRDLHLSLEFCMAFYLYFLVCPFSRVAFKYIHLFKITLSPFKIGIVVKFIL